MKETNSFCSGVAIGFFAFAAILIALGLTPKAEKQRIYNEAVAAGVAEWVVSYDSNGSPVLDFKWKQSNQVF